MRQAKPSEADLSDFETLYQYLSAIMSDEFPRVKEDEDEEAIESSFFDFSEPEDCQKALFPIMDLLRRNPVMLPRILGTISAVFSNDVFDPAKDHLDWHPELKAAVAEREMRKGLLDCHNEQEKEVPAHE